VPSVLPKWRFLRVYFDHDIVYSYPLAKIENVRLGLSMNSIVKVHKKCMAGTVLENGK
jgi:hypothetical protein